MKKNFSTRYEALVTYSRRLADLRHSVVFRLTVWYAGLFSASLAAAFLAFYAVVLHNSHGISHHALSELKEDFLHFFGLPLAIVVLVSSAGGWLMARRALSGVSAVTRTALEISKGALDRRVPVKGDRNEIDRLALTFNQMVDRVQVLISQMKEITENIAHDLRSPITRMRAAAELALMDEGTSEEQTTVVGTIVEECDRLLSMINTMLDISEAEAGLTRLRDEDIDLAAVLLDICELYEPLAEDRQVQLAADVPGSLPVTGDRSRLQRVFANLLDNAIKYTEPGGRVKVSATAQGDFLELVVEDSGVGIGDADLLHIFDRFYRAEKSRSTTGNGLGLSLARAFVLVHGGTISADSRVGSGSRFVVRLPRKART
jgi:signal transduction histidine kinase